MSFLTSAVTAIAVHLRMWVEGLVAPFQVGAAILAAGGDGLKAKAAAALQEPRVQRLGLRFARAFLPNLVLSKQFIAAYPNTGTAIVTRQQDVIEVLDRNADFEVVYEPKMRALTGGENFFLGMQDTPLYTRDTSNMHLAMRRDDVATIIQPLARRLADELVARHQKGLDLPNDLTLQVPTAIVTDYLGITGAANSDLVAWATIMFWYLFVDLAGDAEVGRRRSRPGPPPAPRSIPRSRSARRRARRRTTCSAAASCCRRPASPGWTISASATTCSGCSSAPFRPSPRRASRRSTSCSTGRPRSPPPRRRRARATTPGGRARVRGVPLQSDQPADLPAGRPRCADRGGQPVVAADPERRDGARRQPVRHVRPAARRRAELFRTDRPWDDYILWGYGMHTCFGAHVNRAVMPAILKPLLASPACAAPPAPPAASTAAARRSRSISRWSGTEGAVNAAARPAP